MMRSGICLTIALAVIGAAVVVTAEPLDPVGKDEKCPVCGMFVANYDQWLAQIVVAEQKPLVFDGVKDMMAYYFNSADYGGSVDPGNAEIWVRNYYTLDYIDGRTANYVVGSDVLGPMGEELIPFATSAEAENFRKDHGGSAVLGFEEIDAERIMEMRKKHMMKMKKMKPMKKSG